MKILDYMEKHGHEQICVYTDKGAGLRAFIAIHDTTLGPALGGCRIWPHETEEEAILDVLRLSRAMTHKAAAAGLYLGGGKGLIMADPRKDKSEAMLRAFGRFVESLGGRYITTTDVGTATADMEHIAQETEHVTGLPRSQGGSGDTSIMTGFGVYQGMRACTREAFGIDSLKGRTVAIQGFGKVASHLARHLLTEGARLVVTDIYEGARQQAREIGAEVLEDPEAIYDVECDIFSPCALGGALNSKTIPRLMCGVVAGGANNQLLEERDGYALQERGILYGPDYVLNAGGVINISFEVDGAYDEEAAREKTERIYDTMQQVIAISKERGIPTSEAADRLAEERIEGVRRVRGVYL